MVTFSMKLQSPDFDGSSGHGYELPLPATADSYAGNSMATILALFDGENKTLDFRQLREVITITGVLTPTAATDAGFANVIQMRDEMRRIRARAGNYGKNTGAAKSWLQEDGSLAASANWLTGLPVNEQDALTQRGPGKIRLIWDQYYKPSSATFENLFLYGTVSAVNFGPRPGATTQTRIPFSLTFLVGEVVVG